MAAHIARSVNRRREPKRMTDTTTIEITTEQKRELNRLKTSDGESYKAVIDRLINDNGQLWEASEIEDMARNVVQDELRKARR